MVGGTPLQLRKTTALKHCSNAESFIDRAGIEPFSRQSPTGICTRRAVANGLRFVLEDCDGNEGMT